ncbi:hypothetical protein B0H13DRAFT_1893912 [Mycena leptocephala]|nr:hypothetical protein B0H13DRAFT_1893912 [Mycena leptocephala]
MACMQFSVRENSAQRSACFTGTRIGFGSGNEARPKSKRHAHRDRTAPIGNNPKPSNEANSRLGRKERGTRGETCAPTSSTVDAQSKHPPLPPKKKTANIDGRRKSEENSPMPVEAEVQHAGLQRGGGGGGGEGVLNINGVGTKKKVKEDGRERRREGKQRDKECGGRRNKEGTRKKGRKEREEREGGREEGTRCMQRDAAPQKTGMKRRLTTKPHTPTPQTSPPSLPSSCVTGTSSGQTTAPERGYDGRGGRRASLKQGREVRADKREEEVHWEGEEQGEADGPAQPDGHILDFGHRGLGPVDEREFRAGWRGEGDGRREDGRIGVAVSVVMRGQRSQMM